MFEINFLAPIAVRYEDEHSQPRVIVVGAHIESTLPNFYWSNHEQRNTDLLIDPQTWPDHQLQPRFPEMGVSLSDAVTRQPVFWQLRQRYVNFLFTTTGRQDDLWSVWIPSLQTQGAVVGLQRLDFGRFPSTIGTSIGQLLPSNDDGLRVLASEQEDFNFWNGQSLPFRIRFVNRP